MVGNEEPRTPHAGGGALRDEEQRAPHVGGGMALPDDDDQLLHRAGRGDRDALAVLHERYFAAVLALVRPRAGDAATALDVAEETFAVAALVGRRHRAADGPAVAWLLGVARELLLHSLRRGRVPDRARRRLRRPPLTVDDAALAAVEQRADADALMAILTALPEGTALAITHRVLDMPPGTCWGSAHVVHGDAPVAPTAVAA